MHLKHNTIAANNTAYQSVLKLLTIRSRCNINLKNIYTVYFIYNSFICVGILENNHTIQCQNPQSTFTFVRYDEAMA